MNRCLFVYLIALTTICQAQKDDLSSFEMKGSGELDQIPLKFHVVRDGPVFYDDSTLVAAQIDTANANFLEAGVAFYKCGGINYIDNSPFADGWDPASIVFNLQEEQLVTNAINVFVPNTTTVLDGQSFSSPAGELGYNVQFEALVISGIESLTNKPYLLTHELGHYFGLYHTNSNVNGLELVDSSNCETAGDFCCDTPAEYSGMCCADVEMCQYTPLFGIVTDANGDTLDNPDVENFMSVMQFNTQCQSRFTPDQNDRIRYYFENYLTYLACGATLGTKKVGDAELKISPNPTKGFVEISLENSQTAPLEITVINSTNQVMHQQKIGAFNGTFRLDLSDLHSGLYIVVIYLEDGRRLTSRLVKTR